MAANAICTVCGRTVKIPPYRVETFRACSDSCARQRRRGTVSVRTCKQCGKVDALPVDRGDRPYCSRACYAASLTGKPGPSLTHGADRKHRRTAEYRSWLGMKYRCLNPKSPRYHQYGGRGITVCDRWRDSFGEFYADMGPKPSPNHSLDRIDVDGHYEPSNCRWGYCVATTTQSPRFAGDVGMSDWEWVVQAGGTSSANSVAVAAGRS